VHDVFSSAVLGDGPLGRPVLGTTESITAMRQEQIAEYYRTHYVPPATVVAVSGALDHDAALGAVVKAWEAADASAAPAEPQPVRAGARRPYPGRGVRISRRSSEQAHLVLGTAGVSRHDERRYALGLLSSALGEGMSSRLFQEIREKRGLAYSVYSFTSHYADTGLFGVYAGVAPRRARQVLDLCRQQIEAVATDGITPDELARAKGQARGSIALGLEDTGARMSRLGKSELAQGELLSVDETLARIDAVTPAEVAQVAAEVFGQPLSLGVVGPFEVSQLADAVAE
jgi:predicted Zn-dependent peptidase